MNVMTSHSVVDRMAADLADRRRNSIYRNGAYLALARAILSDEPAEQCTPPACEWQSASIGQSQTAA
jgi:hypothetical protein